MADFIDGIVWAAEAFFLAATRSQVAKMMQNMEYIYGSRDALNFAALKTDSSVVAWGGDEVGGDCSAVQTQLTSDR